MYNDTSIRGYVITDINNDGMLKGLNTAFIKNIASKVEEMDSFKKSIIIAGGLTDYDDLVKLKNLNLNNVEGIIAGKSFYVGNINLTKAQEIMKKNG